MLVNFWGELNHWQDEGGVPAPTGCIPWIGSGWAATCADQHYTLSWICCDAVATVPEVGLPGGGSHKSRRQVPGITSNRSIAMREDEEIIAVLQALVASRRIH